MSESYVKLFAWLSKNIIIIRKIKRFDTGD